MDRDAAQQSFANGELVAPFLRHDAQYAHSFSGDFGADAVTGKHQYVEIQEIRSACRRCQNLLAAAREFRDLLIHQAFLIVRQGCDFRVDQVELFLRQDKTEYFEPAL